MKSTSKSKMKIDKKLSAVNESLTKTILSLLDLSDLDESVKKAEEKKASLKRILIQTRRASANLRETIEIESSILDDLTAKHDDLKNKRKMLWPSLGITEKQTNN